MTTYDLTHWGGRIGVLRIGEFSDPMDPEVRHLGATLTITGPDQDARDAWGQKIAPGMQFTALHNHPGKDAVNVIRQAIAAGKGERADTVPLADDSDFFTLLRGRHIHVRER